MPAIPAYCTHCGALFPSFCSIIDSHNALFIGGKQNCINCGKEADVVSGIFSDVNGALHLVAGSSFSAALVREFAKLLEQSLQEKITPSELQEKAATLNPKLGAIIERAQRTPFSVLFCFLLLNALQQCDFNINFSLDLNRLWDQISASWTAPLPPTSEILGDDVDHAEKKNERANPEAARHSPGEENSSVDHDEPPTQSI